MVTIELKNLHRERIRAIRYLRSRTGKTLKVRGSRVVFQETKARDVKPLLNRFLHQEGLDDYRVIVSQPGLLEVLGPRKKKRVAYVEKSALPDSYWRLRTGN